MLLNVARTIAMRLHEGHVDKAGVDYFAGHVTAVAAGVEGELAKAVAFLHDTLEDCPITADELLAELIHEGIERGVAHEVVAAVDAITKRVHEKPDSHYHLYMNRVKGNELARVVKLSDLAHNMDLSRLGREPNEVDLARNAKYERAVAFLNG